MDQKMSPPVFDEPGSPIIDIFESLIGSDTKRNTVLTNEQLIFILQKEFAMDTKTMHMFELEVYLNVLKKFLKSWPEWEQLGQAVLNLQADGDEEGIALLLKEKHERIKVYLRGMLEIARKMSVDKIRVIKKKEEQIREGKDVIMVVDASLEQLRRLFYKRPLCGSIFNCSIDTSMKQGLNTVTFGSIVNSMGVEMEMRVKYDEKVIVYTRRNKHKLTHTLVNRKLCKSTNYELPSKVGMKLGKLKMVPRKEEVVKLLEEALLSDEKWKHVTDILHKTLIEELVHLPDVLKVTCDFWRYLSVSKYVRYFSKEVEGDIGSDRDKYHLQLEEVISPAVEYSFRALKLKPTFNSVLKFFCTSCQIRFNGDNAFCNIVEHFHREHSTEQDWSCLKCGSVFTASFLTQASWQHTCQTAFEPFQMPW